MPFVIGKNFHGLVEAEPWYYGQDIEQLPNQKLNHVLNLLTCLTLEIVSSVMTYQIGSVSNMRNIKFKLIFFIETLSFDQVLILSCKI